MAPKLRVFTASTIVLFDLASAVRVALKQEGLEDMVQVEPLSVSGSYGHVVLSEAAIAVAPQIEILFCDDDIAPKISNLPGCKLKWVQTVSAGVEKLLQELESDGRRPDLIVTKNFAGMGRQIGEFVLGRILARERKFDRLRELQQSCHYLYNDPELMTCRTMDQISVAVLGFGIIGKEVARLCGLIGMTVWAVVRDERFAELGDDGLPPANHVRPMSRLDEVLQSSDYVVNLLPSTPQTRGLLTGDLLRHCHTKRSVLVNVGRGDVTDEKSLLQALGKGWLSGAILDVHEPEPLSHSSPLWTHPGVSISPHCSGSVSAGKINAVHSFIHNLKCYLAGKPMEAVVNLSSGY